MGGSGDDVAGLRIEYDDVCIGSLSDDAFLRINSKGLSDGSADDLHKPRGTHQTCTQSKTQSERPRTQSELTKLFIAHT